MRYHELGATGLKVSRLCFGTLTICPLQLDLGITHGARLIREALELGVNFIDTAEMYDSYPQIREAMKGFPGEVIIASKSYAHSWEQMEQSLFHCLKGLQRDYVDIFLLHEQESAHTIRGHWEAIEYLVRAKEKGLVRAIGISTHFVAGVQGAASIPELDVIHPIINREGIGIQDGGVQEMLAAMEFATVMGKGLYGMKCLGGGHLIPQMEEAMDFILAVPGLAAVAVGMQTLEEVKYNVDLFADKKPDPKLAGMLKQRQRGLHIEQWCRGCGQCVEKCTAHALVVENGRAKVNPGLCRLCGYCASVCPEFCIKVF